jgi:nitronate monooxygenase
MLIASTPKLVLAQCKAGIVGAFPALNARTGSQLDDWLAEIIEELAAAKDENPTRPPAPFAVNQIVADRNERRDHDLALCVKYRVPVVITSVGPPGEIAAAVHGYGGLVFHDVVNVRHAEKAAAAAVDGIVAVCAGAGGHGGTLNPFAFVKNIRRIFDGTIILAGAITSGADIMSAQLMGADLAYIGTRFLATPESNVADAYKQLIVNSTVDDIVYTALFSGIRGNFLKQTVAASGLDPDNLPESPKGAKGTGGHGDHKLWRDIWAAGHGVGAIDDIVPAAVLIARMEEEYREALKGIVDLARDLRKNG